MIGIISTPVPLQHSQMQYAVYQKPDALLLLYVTVQLPTQDDLVTQLDQQFAWCQLHKHLDTEALNGIPYVGNEHSWG